MRNKEAFLKYRAMQQMSEDLKYLAELGLVECVIDPKTGKEGWRIAADSEESSCEGDEIYFLRKK